MKNPYEDKIREQGLVDQIPTGEGFEDIFDPEWVKERQRKWDIISQWEFFDYLRTDYPDVAVPRLKEFYFTGLNAHEFGPQSVTGVLSSSVYPWYPHESVIGLRYYIEHALKGIKKDKYRLAPQTYTSGSGAVHLAGKSLWTPQLDVDFFHFCWGETYDPTNMTFLGYTRRTHGFKPHRFISGQFYHLNLWHNQLNPNDSTLKPPFIYYIMPFAQSVIPHLIPEVFTVLPIRDRNIDLKMEPKPQQTHVQLIEVQQTLFWQMMMIFDPERYERCKRWRARYCIEKATESYDRDPEWYQEEIDENTPRLKYKMPQDKVRVQFREDMRKFWGDFDYAPFQYFLQEFVLKCETNPWLDDTTYPKQGCVRYDSSSLPQAYQDEDYTLL